MRAWWKKWWPVGKFLLAVVILFAIGRRFAEDLQQPHLWDRPLRPGCLVLSGGVYLLALGCWAGYWHRLMRRVGPPPPPLTSARAYFLGQLGKYLPGKALALVFRAALVAGPRVRVGLAGLTAFYEVLADMAAGALLAAVLFLLLGPDSAAGLDWGALGGLFRLEEPAGTVLDRKVFGLLALALFLPLGVLILPPVFNHLAHRLSRPFREKDAPPLPPFRAGFLAEGLLWATCSWFLMGTSLWVLLQGTLVRPPPWAWDTWALFTASLALAYVAGFIILVVPSGLGVREFFLTLLLANPKEGRDRASIVLAVVVLRLVWTAAEVVLAAVLYWFPTPEQKEIAKRPMPVRQ
jgi:uncharacterized membrane protein YbhN (UPF0104 family)